ncbi:Enzyme that catalyzes the fourth step in the histidine pathway [Entomophthora muscae]|nr:Enzyme that catalyzes the fourth step in the histidine pathway [Entomophthora muscae]
MTKFRPCIDLHQGQVKQIVGGTLTFDGPETLKVNFVSKETPAYYSSLYREHELHGAHLIKLGPNNNEAAIAALKAWPNGLQVGGGITIENACSWLSYGASKIIVTSWLFPEGQFSLTRLQQLCREIGRERIVVDLSCRKVKDGWFVAIDKWQTITNFELCKEALHSLSKYCSEFLIHAADVEGLCQGIDKELVKCLGDWSPLPITYAGGANSIEDLKLVQTLSSGKVDLTYGR